jgi:hypothetical protein
MLLPAGSRSVVVAIVAIGGRRSAGGMTTRGGSTKRPQQTQASRGSSGLGASKRQPVSWEAPPRLPRILVLWRHGAYWP